MVFNGTLKKEFWLFGFWLAALLVVFYSPWLSGQQAFYQSDLTYYFEPFIRYICEAFRQGRIPLWNPYLYCGMSQVAVPSPGMFYPFIVLFMVLPFSQAMAAYLVIHQWVAGVGAFLLATALGWGALAALVAGTAVALCGYMFALQANFTLVSTIAWLPLLIFALRLMDGTLSRVNLSCMFLSSLAMAMMVGAGRPELSVPSALIAFAYLVCTAFGAWHADRQTLKAARQFSFRLCSMIAGGLLAMPILLPALEWARVSPRANGLDLKWVLLWSANWYDCVSMFLAQPLGDLTILGSKYLNMAASRLTHIPYLQSTYIGPIVLTLAIWSLFDRRWIWNWVLLALFVLSLVMSLGSNTPIAPAVLSLSSALTAFRYPVKLMIFPVLAVVALAAHGAVGAENKTVSRNACWCTAIIWTLVFVSGAALITRPEFAQMYISWRHLAPSDRDVMQSAQHLFGESMVTTATIGIAVNLLYIAYQYMNLKRGVYQLIMAAGLAATLVWPACDYLRHGAAGDFYNRPDALTQWVRAELSAQGNAKRSLSNQTVGPRALTLYFDPLTPNMEFLNKQKLGFQEGFYFFARYLMLPNSNVDFGVPYAFGYEAAEVGKFKTLFSAALSLSTQNREHTGGSLSDAPIARFCQITGTRIVLTQFYQHRIENLVPLLDGKFFKVIYADRFSNVRCYRAMEMLPRAYFAERITKGSWEQFLRRMLDIHSDRLMSETYVDDDLPVREPKESSDKNAAPIVFSDDHPERVALSVQRERPALLVLSDQHYPGWNATIDGQPTKIYLVNFFARGVWIPAGKHIVEFSYRPESLTYGLLCAVLVAVAYLVSFPIMTVVSKAPHND